MDRDKTGELLRTKGWVAVDTVLDAEFVGRLRQELDRAYSACRQVQEANGITVNTDGTAHHILIFRGAFLELLQKLPVFGSIREYFGGNFIINSYGGVINMKAKPSYVCKAHRDIRSFSGDDPAMLNMILPLDDFTLENGATYLLTGSHRQPEKPEDEAFFAQADRLVATAGSVALWNSNLWHAAGQNQTDAPRRALTLTFTRPFVKPQLDYPRALGYKFGEELPEQLRQIIGYNARVPASLDEWYQPPEKRMYRPGQG